MPFTIKQLDSKDIHRFRDLLACFASAFDEPKTYLANQPDDGYICDLLCSSSFIAVSALRDGKVIGGLIAYELKKFEQARSEIYIYDLAVSAGHRRIGVATALIEKLKSIAVLQGAWAIYVQAELGDEPAIKLYEKLGVREDVLHFEIEPAGSDDS